jgi:DNA primase large subunit
MAVSDLRKNEMMSHLLDSLEAGKDIGHYGRLVFVMVARHFLSENELLKLLTKEKGVDEEQVRTMITQVQSRDYNPPKREKILQYLEEQKFPICPNAEDPNACNVYRDLQFPETVYAHINEYYQQKANA